MEESMANEKKHIRRICCTYNGFNKNSSPYKILKINLLEEGANEILKGYNLNLSQRTVDWNSKKI
jgi:hypothetical protein